MCQGDSSRTCFASRETFNSSHEPVVGFTQWLVHYFLFFTALESHFATHQDSQSFVSSQPPSPEYLAICLQPIARPEHGQLSVPTSDATNQLEPLPHFSQNRFCRAFCYDRRKCGTYRLRPSIDSVPAHVKFPCFHNRAKVLLSIDAAVSEKISG